MASDGDETTSELVCEFAVISTPSRRPDRTVFSPSAVTVSINVADEPFTDIDRASRRGIQNLLVRHFISADATATLLISTHDKLVMDHAARLIEIRDGRISSDEVKK